MDVAPKASKLKNIIMMDGISDERKEQAEKLNIKLYSFQEVEENGASKPSFPNPPKASDIATFCYTSGTTGDPKGAMVSHAAMISTVAGVFASGIVTNSDDIHLSYLPLAHMFERLIQLAIIMTGGCIGYYQGNTAKLMEDLKVLRPTVFPSVPRLFNKIYDKVTQTCEREGGVKKALFDQAFGTKTYWLQRGYKDHAVWDSVIFSKIKQKLGMDRVRLMVTGSAPIADHVMVCRQNVYNSI